jgi:pimeloyl-ACP methyl ester carboxylesterase
MPESLAELQTNAIAYEKIGSRPPIFFIHGLTYDRRMWDPLVTRLAGDFTCIAIDLPGHGESDDARSYDLLKPQRAFVESASNPRQPVVLGYWREVFDDGPAVLHALPLHAGAISPPPAA